MKNLASDLRFLIVDFIGTLTESACDATCFLLLDQPCFAKERRCHFVRIFLGLEIREPLVSEDCDYIAMRLFYSGTLKQLKDFSKRYQFRKPFALLLKASKTADVDTIYFCRSELQCHKRHLGRYLDSLLENMHRDYLFVRTLFEQFDIQGQDLRDRGLGVLQKSAEKDTIDTFLFLVKHFQFSRDQIVFPGGPLSIACKNNHFVLVKVLTELFQPTKGETRHMMEFLCSFGRLALFSYLCQQQGWTRDEICAKNNLLLRRACSYGQLAMVRWLYRTYGMNEKDASEFDYSAQRSATRNGHSEVVSFLQHQLGKE